MSQELLEHGVFGVRPVKVRFAYRPEVGPGESKFGWIPKADEADHVQLRLPTIRKEVLII